ncbi:class I SAM-dependent methyltransferase [Oceanirhabdus sp. W0125-5]|uniref:class I SAM-dependent methyltransferase n=1 Tax=Oceanirhabdus sp. W0125-5 TaxID=2999116 RepID=UPI0022F2FB03|nr:class I SAM-dependent methyltransferase [Oceanirhabdus sp. W0125-5]WBW95519.1 class I SAM-dependent methyltransferase [Oceanirhabdus sp. W0125-5]
MGGQEQYNTISLKTGGHVKNWNSCKVGNSGEDVYEKQLIDLLSKSNKVLDMGCSCGEFTLEMSQYCDNLIGVDLSQEMIDIANKLKNERDICNVDFICTDSKDDVLSSYEFDLIYCRRGPTSIILNNKCLKSGGTIFGIHREGYDIVKKRLIEAGFKDIKIKEYLAYEYFNTQDDFAKFLNRLSGNIDYTDPENYEKFKRKLIEHTDGAGIFYREWRYIWKAVKP